MFRHLRTKLTVLYAGLFAATLVLIALFALEEVSQNARQVVRSDLAASGAVFERVWAERMGQFENDGVLLSRDFGFRTAVATHDTPTIRSALANLKVRLGIDAAMLVNPDGTVISADDGAPPLDPRLRQALAEGDDAVSGVMTLGGAPYEAVAIPNGDGMQGGWLVFAARLDAKEMRSLETMAAIPLTASVVYRDGASGWMRNRADTQTGVGAGGARPDAALMERFAAASAPLTVSTLAGDELALAKPLKSLIPGQSVMLIAEYPLAQAMGPYRLLLGLLLITGAAGLIVLIVGAGALARTVTRPISQLEAAARSLQKGEPVQVTPETHDEIGRLAETFNTMSAEIRQRETELADALDAAEAANRAKSAFLTNMSHEVRTPLNGVIGVAGVLAGTPLEGEQRKMLGVIQNSATVLQRVLDDVLDLARVEAGGLTVASEAFDLGEVVRTLAESARAACAGKGLSFELAAEPDELGAVLGDRVRLQQILGNLLDNAVKFTERGGVTLSVRRVGQRMVASIADTGVGFDPRIVPQLFNPFHQADGSLTRRFGGSGLGLSISRDLARAMGGDITATGAPGQGATFTVELPLPAATSGAARTSTDASSSATAEAPEGLRILAADDHATNREVVKLILDSVGVDCVCVEDGAEAVAAFAGGGFHLILMDMQMPVMDGLAAIREIRRQERDGALPHTPILMLSANAMPEHVAAAMAAGADAHVAKPVTPPQLIGAIDAALNQEAPEAAGAAA